MGVDEQQRITSGSLGRSNGEAIGAARLVVLQVFYLRYLVVRAVEIFQLTQVYSLDISSNAALGK